MVVRWGPNRDTDEMTEYEDGEYVSYADYTRLLRAFCWVVDDYAYAMRSECPTPSDVYYAVLNEAIK